MISQSEAMRLVSEVSHWHHSFEIMPGLRTPGSYDPTFLWDMLALPKDLSGARVLDIGASNGFFTLNLARAGAEVVAIDYREKEQNGFHVMELLNDISVEYHVMNLYDLDSKDIGVFDIVLFLGVLYHLPDMLRAMHIIRRLCRETLYLETHSDNSSTETVSSARYFRADSLAGDRTNFWSPNRYCVVDMLHDCGFEARREEVWGDRMFCESKAVGTPEQAKVSFSYRSRMPYKSKNSAS